MGRLRGQVVARVWEQALVVVFGMVRVDVLVVMVALPMLLMALLGV